jgi:hypothetical protein
MYWFVKYDALVDAHYKSNSKGVNRSFGDFSTSGDSGELSAVMNSAFMTGIKILERMTTYIEDNSSDYSTYNAGENVLNKVSIRAGIIY